MLPFGNLSDDPEQEYFVDGITNDIITDLSKFSDLFVIAANSTFRYKGRPVRVQDVARDLGVRYVLEGSVQRAGDTLRINAQLVDAATGRHVWAERYERPAEDFFTEARDAIDEALRLSPGLHRQHEIDRRLKMGLSPENAELLREALRKAGLPERPPPKDM